MRMTAMGRNRVMDADDLRRALTRIAHEIMEKNRGAADLALVGIQSKGVPLARRLRGLIHQFEGVEVPVGSLDITLYRDDVLRAPHAVRATEIPFDVSGRRGGAGAAELSTAPPTRAGPHAAHPPRPPRAPPASWAGWPGP